MTFRAFGFFRGVDIKGSMSNWVKVALEMVGLFGSDTLKGTRYSTTLLFVDVSAILGVKGVYSTYVNSFYLGGLEHG